MTKVIAVDFDGTLCENKFPEIGEPMWPVIFAAKAEQERGSKLILWTCRTGKELEEAVAASKEWGLTFDAVNENLPERIELFGNDPRKIGADEYWDDRAVPPYFVVAKSVGYLFEPPFWLCTYLHNRLKGLEDAGRIMPSAPVVTVTDFSDETDGRHWLAHYTCEITEEQFNAMAKEAIADENP